MISKEKRIYILFYFLILYFLIINTIFNIIGSISDIDIFYIYIISYAYYFVLLVFWVGSVIKFYNSYSRFIITIIGTTFLLINVNLRILYENTSNLIWVYTDSLFHKRDVDFEILTQKNIYNLHKLIVKIPRSDQDKTGHNKQLIQEKLDSYAGCNVETKIIWNDYHAIQFSC